MEYYVYYIREGGWEIEISVYNTYYIRFTLYLWKGGQKGGGVGVF